MSLDMFLSVDQAIVQQCMVTDKRKNLCQILDAFAEWSYWANEGLGFVNGHGTGPLETIRAIEDWANG